MSKKPIDTKGFTTLPWAEYRVKAGEIWNSIPAGQPKKKIVEEALGVGRWPDKDGNLIEYTLKSNKDRKENFQRQPVKTRKKNQKAFTKKRKDDLIEANKIVPEEDLKAGKIKQKQIQSVAGRNADHIIEVQTFGPAIEQLKKEFNAGAISKAEYNKRLAILKKLNIGDSVKNFQDLSVVENQTKKGIVEAKNKALKKMEELNPSLRHLTPEYTKAMGIDHTSKLIPTRIAKRAKIAAIGAGALLPGVLGTAASAAEVYERGKIYKESKNWLDGIQLGLANASLFTGWSGVGEIIATPADLLNLGIDAARFGTRKTDTSNRKRFRHGSR